MFKKDTYILERTTFSLSLVCFYLLLETVTVTATVLWPDEISDYSAILLLTKPQQAARAAQLSQSQDFICWNFQWQTTDWRRQWKVMFKNLSRTLLKFKVPRWFVLNFVVLGQSKSSVGLKYRNVTAKVDTKGKLPDRRAGRVEGGGPDELRGDGSTSQDIGFGGLAATVDPLLLNQVQTYLASPRILRPFFICHLFCKVKYPSICQ